MKILGLGMLLSWLCISCGNTGEAVRPVDYVNPFINTQNTK